jgi:dephospho-CoA kinase
MAERCQATGPFLLGLTGPIGCGKSTVGDILLRLGAIERIDADNVVHRLMAPGTEVTRQIESVFGPGVLAPNGAVDRGRLADIVFNDSAALRQLEAMVHPGVRSAIRERLEDSRGRHGVVVVDAVRLLQSELLPLCDAVWVVRCSVEEEMRRLTSLRGMPPDAARGRLAAQPSFDHPKVDRVIWNDGTMEELERNVKAAWERLLVEAASISAVDGEGAR